MKNVFLLGDFSVDLLKNAEHAEQMNFLSHFIYVFTIYIASLESILQKQYT